MINKIFLLVILSFLLSCGTLKDAGKALRNEKTNTTDEFLIKKKEPLVLPPDYDKVPKPGTLSSREKNEEDKIKKILKAPIDKKVDKNKKSSSVEESIIDKIRK